MRVNPLCPIGHLPQIRHRNYFCGFSVHRRRVWGRQVGALGARRWTVRCGGWERYNNVSIRKDKQMTKEFNVIIERDEEGYYVASVPELQGCHTQARSLDKLMERIREAIELCLEVQQDLPSN